MTDDDTTVFDLVGGEQAFHDLVDDFYAKVEDDPVLRPIYPESFEPGKTHLARFLAEYWGGDAVYTSERGHPRLRMRHRDFEITPEAAERWAEHMSEAIIEQGWPSRAEQAVLQYVERFTPGMVNSFPPIEERG